VPWIGSNNWGGKKKLGSETGRLACKKVLSTRLAKHLLRTITLQEDKGTKTHADVEGGRPERNRGTYQKRRLSRQGQGCLSLGHQTASKQRLIKKNRRAPLRPMAARGKKSVQGKGEGARPSSARGQRSLTNNNEKEGTDHVRKSSSEEQRQHRPGSAPLAVEVAEGGG